MVMLNVVKRRTAEHQCNTLPLQRYSGYSVTAQCAALTCQQRSKIRGQSCLPTRWCSIVQRFMLQDKVATCRGAVTAARAEAEAEAEALEATVFLRVVPAQIASRYAWRKRFWRIAMSMKRRCAVSERCCSLRLSPHLVALQAALRECLRQCG